MDSIYTIILAILGALAVSGLVVGVANDAVNFLNSALGSKAAPRYVILIVASVGIIVGAITSSGMMEIARSGVFHPGMFTFSEIMMLFLAVMFANVILLDVFNTLGMPTSTTVSLVFGLLGAAVGVSIYKIDHDVSSTLADLSQYINTGKALAIISGILLSVGIALVCGTIVMYITRVIFSFRYKNKMKHLGALWCGIALTAISYFAVFKGLSDTAFADSEVMAWISGNTFTAMVIMFVGWSVLMSLLSLLRVNILRITVLAGTFSLALAFAGNDLVNFIGVFVAGFDSYNIVAADEGNASMTMEALSQPVVANTAILLISGTIMILTLWTSKKARTVTETEINLARQGEGEERFGSTSISRAMVRWAVNINKNYERVTPLKVQRFIDSRFIPLRGVDDKDKAPFDLIRATVNLTVASILIAMATSMTLPLSTTYVTFMVAMGSSLADRAWGRESAVYRITGVLVVISGWFLTGFIAFFIAFLVALALMWGQVIAIIAFTVACAYILIHSSVLHSKKLKKNAAKKEEEGNKVENTEKTVLEICRDDVAGTMEKVTVIYNQTLSGLFNEDRRLLKNMMRESDTLFAEAHERKHQVLPMLQKLKENYIETGHYYVQAVDYMNEVAKALVHITRPSFEHINNNHEGMSKEQVQDLRKINDEVSVIYAKINVMLLENDFSELDHILEMRDYLLETLEEAIKRQITRVKRSTTTTKSSVLYLNIINETKTMVLQTRNLLKSQKSFISN